MWVQLVWRCKEPACMVSTWTEVHHTDIDTGMVDVANSRLLDVVPVAPDEVSAAG